jgi:adenylate cyclase
MVRQLLEKHGERWAFALLMVVMACMLALGLLPTHVIDRLDLYAYDLRMQVHKPQLDPRIVVVDIDQKSLSEIGRWPWSRDVIAQLVNQLGDKYHVRSVGFDVLFNEADTTSGYSTLVSLANSEFRDVPGFSDKLRALKPTLDYDGRFAKALQDKPVVLSFFLSRHAPKGTLPEPAFKVADLQGRTLDSITSPGYDAALPALAHAARAGGYMNTEIDADGLLRSIPLLSRIGDGYYESLSLATARVALDADKVSPVFLADQALMTNEQLRKYGTLAAIEINTAPRPLRIPVETGMRALIEYRGHGGPDGGAFRYIPAVDVIKGRVSMEDLFDRIVLVGTTAPGLNDLRATPVNSEYPGVEAHANMIASMLDGSFKQRPDFAAGFDLLQVIAVGLLLALVLPVLTPTWSILLAAASTAAVIGFNFWMYQSLNLVMPIATVLLLVIVLFVFNLAWGYLFEHRKGRAMVHLFGEYVAPELVEEMASNPESYNMEGDSRVLTVLFCDVRGFTTISEGLDPNALREYINLYLTAMSEDIRGNRGTLDKYIGDAVMAFWGAPVALPDHASRAVATALKMQASANKLNTEFVARGWPPLKIGIGLNTGNMRVGDMGSKIRRAYTVMGDAVNLASRLEGITKIYGAAVVVGDATRHDAPEYAYRELDRVRVKGKHEPVPIFEPLAPDAELDPARRAALQKWHAALDLVRAQQWDTAEQAIAELHAAWPDDLLYLLYLERIAHYRAQPPGPDWDGVTTFATK